MYSCGLTFISNNCYYSRSYWDSNLVQDLSKTNIYIHTTFAGWNDTPYTYITLQCFWFVLCICSRAGSTSSPRASLSRDDTSFFKAAAANRAVFDMRVGTPQVRTVQQKGSVLTWITALAQFFLTFT